LQRGAGAVKGPFSTGRSVAQSGSASVWGTEGRGFESRRSDQFIKDLDASYSHLPAERIPFGYHPPRPTPARLRSKGGVGGAKQARSSAASRPLKFAAPEPPMASVIPTPSAVCRVLEIAEPHRAAARLDDDEKGRHTMTTPGGPQDVTIISESGLYSLILTSREDGPWFVLTDVCRVLEIADPTSAARRLDDDEKVTVDRPAQPAQV
jgi:hypothetical protein